MRINCERLLAFNSPSGISNASSRDLQAKPVKQNNQIKVPFGKKSKKREKRKGNSDATGRRSIVARENRRRQHRP
ncbi:hypothetical protein PUN28_010240 [Cardiocondyla obscurior]|uniref:Uncharacterized protein n=1 Tax=Cardiocondyla obscurior TaxID=286306 RepID=A0AAW2FP98_9HYME